MRFEAKTIKTGPLKKPESGGGSSGKADAFNVPRQGGTDEYCRRRASNGVIATGSARFLVRFATDDDREHIYRIRHEIYSRELGQHAPNSSGVLSDPIDRHNIYIVAVMNGAIAGFVSVTPPGANGYSIDKYVVRSDFPLLAGESLFEIRLLTVLNRYRGREIAGLLMYAALRFVESRRGERIVAIGRREVLALYLHVGLEKLGCTIQSGAVVYELLAVATDELSDRVQRFTALLDRLERCAEWQLDFSFRKPASCFHGGAFFDYIGSEFGELERRRDIINADVLDAWFEPAPAVIDALQRDLSWIMRTSPPAACDGMLKVIARARGIPEHSLLPGAGSSDLIFLALRQWLSSKSRVLILDPTYGEYSHVFERVVRCRVDRLILRRSNQYQPDLQELRSAGDREYDLIVLVNPNSPTGRHVPRSALESLLSGIPPKTRVWVDETYVEYAGEGESIEAFAARSRNVFVCKSMSKVYALSGVRAAYLCGPSAELAELRALTPPWAVSLPGQIAAVSAVSETRYYLAKYQETHRLRTELLNQLSRFEGWEIIPGRANFLLCHLPESGPSAAALVRRSRERGLYLRDAAGTGRNLGSHALRIAVKDRDTNFRMVNILAEITGTS